jgi:hypothetical protein
MDIHMESKGATKQQMMSTIDIESLAWRFQHNNLLSVNIISSGHLYSLNKELLAILVFLSLNCIVVVHVVAISHSNIPKHCRQNQPEER